MTLILQAHITVDPPTLLTVLTAAFVGSVGLVSWASDRLRARGPR